MSIFSPKKKKTEIQDETRPTKRKITASTQKHIPFAEIRNDAVIMQDGTLRSALLVSSVNFALKSDEEQEALVRGYVQFLNSFDFPMQIVIQSRRLRIEDYLETLKTLEKKQENELLRIQTGEYRRYVSELVELGDIMTKRFYLVVPYHPLADRQKSFISRMWELLTPASAIKLSEEKFLERHRELMKRVDHVTAALNSMGLSSAMLTTEALIELYYNTYNPRESLSQPLPNLTKIEVEV